jgi:hypothetical protein
VVGLCCALAVARFAAVDALGQTSQPTLSDILDQNRRLEEQIANQQKVIDSLQERVSGLESAKSPSNPGAAENDEVASASPTVRISAEAGFAYFQSGSDGVYSGGFFRVDEARLYLDASVWKDVYFHSELDLVTREANDNDPHFGELYATVDNLSGHWDQDNLVNLRIGRFNIPFGEEYQTRTAIANPLISHSLSDIWGFDSGVEAYGSEGRFDYAAAVLDGGVNILKSGNTGKSFAGRIGYGSGPWRLSASAMSTGHLNPNVDELSAVWIGNGFFRSISATPGNTHFWADLAEVDASASWKRGHLKAAAGRAWYDDDVAPGDSRRLDYFYVEGVQFLVKDLFAAVRFSRINAPNGYFLTGQGSMADYLFGTTLTTELDRLSLGLGYEFAPPVILKVEYSPEWGRTTTGENRDNANLFSTELAVKF